MTDDGAITVLIADDHPVVREGVKQIIGKVSDIVICGEAADGDEALDRIRNAYWDVVVLDVTMPGMGVLDILKRIKDERPGLPVLILSMHPEDQYALRLFRAGASGYVSKAGAAKELVHAIRKVADGGMYVSPALAEHLAIELKSNSDHPPHEVLSDREFQVLCLIASGKSLTETANELSLNIKTISTYRSRILQKLNIKSNAELAHYAIHNRLIPFDPFTGQL